jgi:hypothetical protein
MWTKVYSADIYLCTEVNHFIQASVILIALVTGQSLASDEGLK